MARSIEFYHTEKGSCPIRDFLASVDGKEAQKVLWVFRLIDSIICGAIRRAQNE